MITIRELKKSLSKFSDDYVVAAMENDRLSILAIYKYASETPNQIALEMGPEPVGYISTLGGLVVAYDSEDDQIGRDITDD